MMTRAVNVEALKPCSAPTMKYASSARAVPGVRPLAGELVQEARRRGRATGRARSGPCPARSRAKAASADGENAVSARACSTVGGQGERPGSRPTPRPRCAARPSAWSSVGSARRTVEDGVGHRRPWAGDGSDPSRRSTAGWRPPGTCRARRGRRCGSRDTAAARCAVDVGRGSSRRRRRPRGPASRAVSGLGHRRRSSVDGRSTPAWADGQRSPCARAH